LGKIGINITTGAEQQRTSGCVVKQKFIPAPRPTCSSFQESNSLPFICNLRQINVLLSRGSNATTRIRELYSLPNAPVPPNTIFCFCFSTQLRQLRCMENKVEKNFVSQTVNKVSIYSTLDEVNFALCSGICSFFPKLRLRSSIIYYSHSCRKEPARVINLYNT
jgi:hypothetical protein